MDVGGYRDSYEGFYEKTSYRMSINRGRMVTTKGAHASLARILYILLFLSWEFSFSFFSFGKLLTSDLIIFYIVEEHLNL